MNHWNHRVIAHNPGDFDTAYFAVHECYYSGKSKYPFMWTENPVAVIGDDLKGLRKTLRYMTRALKHPVLMVKGKKLVEYPR
jgi:hypothetical protein